MKYLKKDLKLWKPQIDGFVIANEDLKLVEIQVKYMELDNQEYLTLLY